MPDHDEVMFIFDLVAIEHHNIILVHGIRTRALWLGPITKTLKAAGFSVSPTNYGRFDLFRFLLPVPFFRAWATSNAWEDISTAIRNNPGKSYSVICHSFGTHIVSRLLKRKFNFEPDSIIFCGSIVKYRFRFQDYDRRYRPPVLNDVGASDIWPVLAESITWGYGSSGTYGFNRPGVEDRYHKGLSHSDFLNAEFCERFWIPFLKYRCVRSTDDFARDVPWYLDILSVFRLKYFILLFFFLSAWSILPLYAQCDIRGRFGLSCASSDSSYGPQQTKIVWRKNLARINEPLGKYSGRPGSLGVTNREKLHSIVKSLELDSSEELKNLQTQLAREIENAPSYPGGDFWNMEYTSEIVRDFDLLKNAVRDKSIENEIQMGN